MELNLLIFGSLVPGARCCVLCKKVPNLVKVWHEWQNFWQYFDLRSHTKRQTHTGHTSTNRMTRTYACILTPPVVSTLQLPVFTEWITCWYKNLLYRYPQCLCFLEITYLQRLYTFWLGSRKLSPSCETQRILIKMVQMSKIHTTHHTHTQKEIILERVSVS